MYRLLHGIPLCLESDMDVGIRLSRWRNAGMPMYKWDKIFSGFGQKKRDNKRCVTVFTKFLCNTLNGRHPEGAVQGAITSSVRFGLDRGMELEASINLFNLFASIQMGERFLVTQLDSDPLGSSTALLANLGPHAKGLQDHELSLYYQMLGLISKSAFYRLSGITYGQTPCSGGESLIGEIVPLLLAGKPAYVDLDLKEGWAQICAEQWERLRAESRVVIKPEGDAKIVVYILLKILKELEELPDDVPWSLKIRDMGKIMESIEGKLKYIKDFEPKTVFDLITLICVGIQFLQKYQSEEDMEWAEQRVRDQEAEEGFHRPAIAPMLVNRPINSEFAQMLERGEKQEQEKEEQDRLDKMSSDESISISLAAEEESESLQEVEDHLEAQEPERQHLSLVRDPESARMEFENLE